jgi:hypothetical protein
VNLARRHPPGFFTLIRQQPKVSQIDESVPAASATGAALRWEQRWGAELRGSSRRTPTCLLVGKLLGFVGAAVGSSAGWWVGAHVGFMSAFFMSVVGTGAGLYVGRRLASEYLS